MGPSSGVIRATGRKDLTPFAFHPYLRSRVARACDRRSFMYGISCFGSAASVMQRRKQRPQSYGVLCRRYLSKDRLDDS